MSVSATRNYFIVDLSGVTYLRKYGNAGIEWPHVVSQKQLGSTIPLTIGRELAGCFPEPRNPRNSDIAKRQRFGAGRYPDRDPSASPQKYAATRETWLTSYRCTVAGYYIPLLSFAVDFPTELRLKIVDKLCEIE